MKRFETAIVDLHWLGRRATSVLALAGAAFRVVDQNTNGVLLTVGDDVRVGETLVLEPGAEVVLETMVLEGGRRGRAHTFVPEDAFKSTPSKEDVPKLLEQLEQLERAVLSQTGEDPLAAQAGPKTSFERALSSEFALQNLNLSAARGLPEAVARAEQAVCLFFHGDQACVAMPRMSVRRVRTIMSALRRPVNPHLVDEETARVLLETVYARFRAE
ncbi:MAG: hypothetical protein U1E65_01960 [Myxococcota bacterium]